MAPRHRDWPFARVHRTSRMVSLILMFLAVSGTSMVSADQPSRVTTLADSERVTLRVGATVSVRNNSARVTFVRVSEDSRCPVGVTCVWAGDAVVHVRVDAEGDRAFDLQLHTNRRFRQADRAGELMVTLLGLEPIPQADQAIEAGGYTATLEISIN